MKNYKHYQWTCNSKEEAILTRVTHEKELFGEFGSNKDLYYLINHPSPIEEIKIIFSEGA